MAMNWQPIESAPKDGTDVVVLSSQGAHVVAWDGEDWRCADMKAIYAPTHWMPLPEPPAS